MNKYKNLISNTLIFAIGTFSSKLLVFLLMPLYTRLLPPVDYGTMDLVVNSCNLIIPIMTVSIHEAVIRFGMDRAEKKRDVFTTGILTIFAGYLLLLLFYPLISRIKLISDYTLYIYLYALTSALRSTVSQFVRASGFVRIFALDGVLTTVTTVALNVLFLAGLRTGVAGYLMATILADALSALSLFLLLRLWRFFRPRGLSWQTAAAMLRYSAPLMPTALFWWVINLSDHYFVAYIAGVDVNGLYSAAYKIPTIITLVSSIFTHAWQLSAFAEYQSEEGEHFFSTIFKSYYTFVFLAASAIILLIKPITRILVAPEYFESWRFVPFLVLAVSFSCLVTFLGTVYNAVKKNRMVTVTSLLGAVTNIVLNAALIPRYGANGAAFATFVSFLLVFVIRAVDTRKYIAIRMQPVRIFCNLALLLAQVWAALAEPPYWVLFESGVLLLIILCNFGHILFLLRRVQYLLRGRLAH